MEMRGLGSSQLDVSVLGLGCWPLGGGPGWGDGDERESIATIHAALDWVSDALKSKLGSNVDFFQGWDDRRTR